ncbi:hypothetical protein ACKEMB_004799 [Klebsiella pneumoniae]
MRTHKLNKSRKLYRSDNTTTRHYSINPGGEYRWGRNRKKAVDELLAKRETMHGRQKRGRDYTPLFYFLVKQIGQPWDKVFSEVCGRLDTTEPVFWLVALHEHQKRDLVRIGDSSFYPGLFVDGNGILQQVNRKRAARTVLTGMCYSVGSATRQGSSSLTRFIGQSAITSSTWRR